MAKSPAEVQVELLTEALLKTRHQACLDRAQGFDSVVHDLVLAHSNATSEDVLRSTLESLIRQYQTYSIWLQREAAAILP